MYNKGASLRVVNSKFHTPAHVAVEANHLAVLEWLHRCDNNLIPDFFDYEWNQLLRDNYLFTLKPGNGKIFIPKIYFPIDHGKMPAGRDLELCKPKSSAIFRLEFLDFLGLLQIKRIFHYFSRKASAN